METWKQMTFFEDKLLALMGVGSKNSAELRNISKM